MVGAKKTCEVSENRSLEPLRLELFVKYKNRRLPAVAEKPEAPPPSPIEKQTSKIVSTEFLLTPLPMQFRFSRQPVAFESNLKTVSLFEALG